MDEKLLEEFLQLFKKAKTQNMENTVVDGVKSATSYFKEGKNGPKMSSDLSDFVDFYEKNYPNTRRDWFRDTVYTKDIRGDWTPIDNHRKLIESDCAEVGLNPTYVERHMAKWANSKKPELLIDVPEWDGTDHMGQALKKIKTSNIKHEFFVELMKEWFGSIIQRIQNPKHQNRFVVFRGSQGIGKDYSINAMLSGFQRYANEIDIQQSKTEIYRTIKNLAVAIIPEFDETQKSSISVLKSIVTARSIEMRDLYKNESTSRPIRCSFISASNFDDILRDSSGNRRFVIFDISSIEHSFDEISGDQILAQSFDLARRHYRASREAEREMREIIRRETPISSDSLFVEELQEFLLRKAQEPEMARNSFYDGNMSSKFLAKIPDKIRWPNIAEDVTRMGKKYGLSGRKCQQILKRSGFAHYDTKSTYYAPWPTDNLNSN